MTDIPLPLDPPQPKKPGSLSAKAESLNLLYYGTAAFDMTPAMIFQAARQDIASYAHNIRVAGERREEKASDDPHTKNIDPARPLAFVKKHVKAARKPADVLRAALADIASGIGSQDPNTARLYNNAVLLQEALDLADHTPA